MSSSRFIPKLEDKVLFYINEKTYNITELPQEVLEKLETELHVELLERDGYFGDFLSDFDEGDLNL